MGSGLIQMAIPTDEDAINYLKSVRGADDPRVTALMAKSLYPDKVKSNRHFICPTKGCEGPITCRSIRETNVNQPTFVNQSRLVNLHARHCKHHPENIEAKENEKKSPQENYASHFDSGRTISSISRLKGFIPIVPNRKPAINPSTSGKKMLLTGGSDREGQPKEKKGVMHRLRTLQQHVELYIDAPDFRIINQSSRGDIPISEMFKSIEENVLYENMLEKENLTIYTGRAYLAETSNDTVLAIRFKEKVAVEGQEYRPSMIISKEYFLEEYEDIYDEFINDKQYEFDVFTTLPFFLNDKYLNFSSYMIHERINPFGEELYTNFYIR